MAWCPVNSIVSTFNVGYIDVELAGCYAGTVDKIGTI